MKHKTLLTAVVSGFVLLGCAYPWPSVTSKRDCSGQDCEVAVTPTQHSMVGFSCFVERADPDVLHVKHPRPVNVHWYLDVASASAGYKFPQDGIVFQNPAGWACRVHPLGARFTCINTAGPGPHKYTVNVVNGSTRCDPLDPMIIND